MVTLSALAVRYPAMSEMSQERFDMFCGDAKLVMGDDEERWLGFYDPAMAALIAHMAVTNADDGSTDSGLPNAPVTRTDVDDVQVEFAEGIWNKVPYVEADLYSTSYGQAYVRWRRMAFAGPRIV